MRCHNKKLQSCLHKYFPGEIKKTQTIKNFGTNHSPYNAALGVNLQYLMSKSVHNEIRANTCVTC